MTWGLVEIQSGRDRFRSVTLWRPVRYRTQAEMCCGHPAWGSDVFEGEIA